MTNLGERAICALMDAMENFASAPYDNSMAFEIVLRHISVWNSYETMDSIVLHSIARFYSLRLVIVM